MNKQTEHRNGPISQIELRETGDGTGTFEGYACLFNQIDDYNSRFLPGAFRKTLSERANKVKVLDGHGALIGKPLELREDDKGLFVSGQLTQGVQAADECHLLMKSGALDTLSFGFRVPPGGDQYRQGVREIKEVILYEISPVTFAANENAVITNVRSMNFNDTLNQENVLGMAENLFEALERTVDDIWWGSSNNDELMSALNKALDQFKAQFMKYAQNYVDTFRANDNKRSIFGGELAIELRKHCDEQNCTIEDMAKSSVFSTDELEGLLLGTPCIPSDKLAALPENIRAAHQRERNARVERLCSELRNGVTTADKVRIAALLEFDTSASDPVQSVISKLEQYRSRLAG